MEGWIKIHRKLIEWDWYTDSNTKSLFIHLLLKCNVSDKTWRGIIIKRGEVFTSISHLSSELGLSIKQIRICLEKLQNTGEIKSIGANNGTMITVCKYDSYQCNEEAKGQTNRQTKGKRGANEGQQHKNIRIKELKELKEIGIDDNFLEIVFDWLEYKKDKKENYSSEKTLLVFYNNLLNYSKNNKDVAREIINQSIGNNWSGIFELKNKTAVVENKSTYIRRIDDYGRPIYDENMNIINYDK